MHSVHYRSSISPPYILQSTTDTVPVRLIQIQPFSITYTLLETQFSPPYTPQSTAYQVLVFCIICSPLKNQYQSRINCRVQCRPSTSLPYTLQSSTELVPVLILLYSSLWTQYHTYVHSAVTTDTVKYLCTL